MQNTVDQVQGQTISDHSTKVVGLICVLNCHVKEKLQSTAELPLFFPPKWIKSNNTTEISVNVNSICMNMYNPCQTSQYKCLSNHIRH